MQKIDNGWSYKISFSQNTTSRALPNMVFVIAFRVEPEFQEK